MTQNDPSPSIAQTEREPATRPLVVVSNRLPISMQMQDGRPSAAASSGGLASALGGFQTGGEDGGFLWIGWPGAPVPKEQHGEVAAMLSEQRLVPVFLEPDEEEHYYRGICNQVLWPLLHYFTDRVAFSDESWRVYQQINRRFADTVLAHCHPNSRVWVHDFHLMLLPTMLREERPDLEIGFFLHIPFPSSEIYRLLPTRDELLEGVLGADYIGFHTNEYARHFRSTCLRVLGVESDPKSVSYEGRRVAFGADPIGVDVEGFERTLREPETADLIDELHQRYRDRKLVLGVERLDYTKGILLKLQAYERFLERDPRRAREVTLLQVLVPSRLSHPDYQELKSEIEEFVGRLNGRFGGPGVTPVEYMHRSVTPNQLSALYRFAHVGLVTPIRDGMNLIAQEFVLCQQEVAGRDDAFRGVLVLSEFAGAAHHLSPSILVNPWDVERTADALETALQMGPREKAERMRFMVAQVRAMACRRWARIFLERQGEAAEHNRQLVTPRRLRDDDVDELRRRFRAAPRRLLALDYDGTLREITQRPEEASPTREIVELLQRLTALPSTRVHLISGRKRETLDDWFEELPLYVCAEHGFVAKVPGGDWQPLHDVDLGWMPAVEELFERVAREVPGARVERKSCGLAWHYRMTDLDYGIWRARELMSTLEADFAHQPIEVISGHRVIEVRARGVNKGAYLERVMAEVEPDTFVLCAGDDRTDQDMYRVLPEEAVSVHVGAAPVSTRHRVESPARLRALLRRLAEQLERP